MEQNINIIPYKRLIDDQVAQAVFITIMMTHPKNRGGFKKVKHD